MSGNNIAEEIKSRCNIVDVVGRYVELKRAGGSHKGLCPFHNEKTPSFVVSESKQFFYCFGCGASGDVISFLIQVFSSFPELLFAMDLMYALGSVLMNLYLTLGFLSWANTARLIRGTVLQLKEQEYIQACRIDGGSSLRIILKHLFPNCIPMLIVSCTLGIPSAILTEASLSYLGLGVPSPTASWGSMISGAQTFIRTNTYYSLFPGLCIILTVIAFNTLGDGLRDVLDPKLRK